MSKDWPVCSVDDVRRDASDGLATGPFGSSVSSKFFQPFGIPMIRGSNLSEAVGDRLLEREYVFVSEEKANAFPRAIARRGDIIFTCWGTIGQVGLIDERSQYDRYLISNKQMKLSTDPTKADSLFLYYLFVSPTMRAMVQSVGIGSSVPGFNLGQLRSLTFPLPPLPVQRAIAGVLGALDDKIEANRQTSRLLERIARSIFRAWFIDFEPVKAKAAGARSFPSMPQEVFDSLPGRLVESELGPVPDGWGVASIGDAVSVRGGGTPSTKVEEYWGGTHCWLTPKDLSGVKDPILLSTDRKVTDKGLEKISSGLLPVGTILLSSRAPVGYLVISSVPTAINQGFIAMVCDGPLPPLYVYHWTQSVMDEIKSRASGTTFPEISKAAFRPIKACVPTPPVLGSFTAAVEPFFEKITANIKESQSLERLRDYLLPKLLSGDVRVQVGLLPNPVADKSGIPSNEGADNAQ